jgi:PAS domain S-box-containing protein
MKKNTINRLIGAQLAVTLFIAVILSLLLIFFSGPRSPALVMGSVALLCVIVFAGCSALSVLSLQRVLGSLENLTQAVRGGLSGTRDFEVEIADSVQLSELADAFNLMALSLFSAEDALEASETRFEKLVECIPDAVIVEDSSGTILNMNEKACWMYGLSRAELLGGNSLDVVPLTARAEAMRNLRRWFVEPPHGVEMLFHNADGTAIPVQVSGAPIIYGGQRSVVLILRDISTQKQVELTLDDAYQKADRLSRLQTNFLSNVSHEIRTPMNAISGLSELLRSTEMTAEQMEYSEMINDSCSHLLNMLTTVVDLAKLESGYMAIKAEPFDIREVVENLGGLFATRGELKGLEFDLSVDEQLPGLFVGDAARVQQVLNHLLDNALKFTRKGHVTFKVALADPGHVRPNSVCPVSFSVSDTGVGMSDDLRRSVFNIFSQADGSSTREHGGMGIGLALCQRVIEKMGGALKMTSQEGQGSTFSFVIPLKTGSSVERPVGSDRLA